MTALDQPTRPVVRPPWKYTGIAPLVLTLVGVGLIVASYTGLWVGNPDPVLLWWSGALVLVVAGAVWFFAMVAVFWRHRRVLWWMWTMPLLVVLGYGAEHLVTPEFDSYRDEFTARAESMLQTPGLQFDSHQQRIGRIIVDSIGVDEQRRVWVTTPDPFVDLAVEGWVYVPATAPLPEVRELESVGGGWYRYRRIFD